MSHPMRMFADETRNECIDGFLDSNQKLFEDIEDARIAINDITADLCQSLSDVNEMLEEIGRRQEEIEFKMYQLFPMKLKADIPEYEQLELLWAAEAD